MNVCLKISYVGYNYFGFQKQKEVKTIQGEFERIFFEVFKKSIRIIGCSRTDAGVHAKEYYLNFNFDMNIQPIKIKVALNSRLPYDIKVLDAFYVSSDFNARHDAVKKEYEYRIFNGEVISPFDYLYNMHYKYELDVYKMKEAARFFIGTHDFKAFMTTGSCVNETVRTIFESNVVKEGNTIIYSVLGNGFLYNMVRIIVGTLIMVGQNRIKTNEISNIISMGNRVKAGFVSDAKGLCLKKVFYDKLT